MKNFHPDDNCPSISLSVALVLCLTCETMLFNELLNAYAAVKGVALSGLAALLLGVVMTNGLLEMAIGAVIVLAVGRVLLPLTKGKIKKAAGE